MRRSDQRVRPARRWSGRPLLRGARLPEPVYREFVGTLFEMALPVAGMGLLFAAVAGVAARQLHDPCDAALGVAAAIVTAVRIALIGGYRRARPGMTIERTRLWERRYAIGSYAFALLLGLFNVRALMFHLPVLHLFTVSLVFTLGAGIVSRISVRPLICVVSLLLATVPTAAALAAHALMPNAAALHAQLFAVEALLVTAATGLSLQTVAHLYRSAVLHHTAMHDLGRLAKYDALTGLPNRLLLRERFAESAAAATPAGGGALAIHFIDLDGFKAINDRHGHLAGDAMLRLVAARLSEAVRSEDMVARLGGDEFIILQTDVRHEDEAGLLARRVIRALTEPFAIEGTAMRISASVGIAMGPERGLELESLIACADAALYRSKGSGKGRLHFCTREDRAEADRAAA